MVELGQWWISKDSGEGDIPAEIWVISRMQPTKGALRGVVRKEASYALIPRMSAWDTPRAWRPIPKMETKGQTGVRVAHFGGILSLKSVGNTPAKPSRSHSLSGVWGMQALTPLP